MCNHMKTASHSYFIKPFIAGGEARSYELLNNLEVHMYILQANNGQLC